MSSKISDVNLLYPWEEKLHLSCKLATKHEHNLNGRGFFSPFLILI